MLPKLLNGKEVAEFLHISKGLAYRLMAQGDLPTIRFSEKTVRVRQDDLEKFIELHANNTQETIPGSNGNS